MHDTGFFASAVTPKRLGQRQTHQAHHHCKGQGTNDHSIAQRIQRIVLACGDDQTHKNEMACDLYVTVLQQLGFETDTFATSKSNLNGALL